MPPPSLRLHHLRRLSTVTANPIAAVSEKNPISISKLRSEHDPDKALEIYSKIKSSRNSLELVARRLAKLRRPDDVIGFLDSHKRDPLIKTEPFLSSIIRCYGVVDMPDKALDTYHQMDQLGTPRTVFSFNVVLNALVQSKSCEKVPTLFEELSEKYKIVPNEVSYGILVKSYCELGLPEKAMEVLEQMKDKNVEITTVTYTTLMNVLYKKGKNDEAEKVWEKMLKNGCELDVAAYNVRIVNAGKDIEKVKGLIEEMGNSGLKPDLYSYNALMNCYFNNGNFEEAKKVYKGWEANGCKPNAQSFRILIHHLCRNKEFEDAYELFKDCVRANKIPDFGVLKPLAVGLVEKNKIDEAKAFFSTLKKKFNPSLMTAWNKVEMDLGLVSQDGAE